MSTEATTGDRRTTRSNVAIYKDIVQHYRQLVDSGELKPGDRLPTNEELTELHETSWGPVSKAMKLLKQDGVVYTTHAGTFVGKRPRDPRQNEA